MNFLEMQELLKVISEMELTEFKMKNGDFELTVRTKEYNKGRVQAPIQAVPIQAAPVVPPVSIAPAPAPTSESTPAPVVEKAAETKYLEVKSPIVGTFYRSAGPEKPAYVKVGDKVEKGAVVCIVEAMKLFNEIESEVTGTIVKVMVEDAQPVEYDQVLFLVEP